jgi:hypothetical protein
MMAWSNLGVVTPTRGVIAAKKPVAIIRGARKWTQGDPWGEGQMRYNLEIHKEGPPTIYDTKTRAHLSPAILSNTGFIVPNWEIDHIARLRFTVKTLLGVGWKFFQTDLLAAIDVDQLRPLLTRDFVLSASHSECPLRFSDPFLIKPEDRETHPLTRISPALIRNGVTTILVRYFDHTLEWSIACLGHLVGSVWVPCRESLLGGDVQPKGGLRLVIRRDRLEPELVAPFD